jgi:choline dehydrogenase-like flavoprotein
MRLDLADLEPGSVLDADLCVVGGGPAGLCLARELLGSRLQVVLLEGGGSELEGETQKLYSGPAAGTILDERPGYLATSRYRLLGGSANYWQGFCRPQDPIDFEAREWVPDSGWPIRRDELRPHYERAAAHCRVPSFDDARDRGEMRAVLLGDDPDLETTFVHVSPERRFGVSLGDELAAAPNARLVTHANVVRLVTGEAGRRVIAVEAAALDGRRLTVRARGVVLAAGGVENARLLLASGGSDGRGLGNDRDLVGRYFMEHPFLSLGYLVVPYWRWPMRPYNNADAHGRKQVARCVLRPSDEMQRRERLLNAMLVFDEIDERSAPELAAEVTALATEALQLAEGHPDPEPGFDYLGTLELAVEPPPEAENRITLAAERDALGVPRAAVRWSIGEQATTTVRTIAETFVRRMGAELRGRAYLIASGDELWPRARPSNHHMGTTRMATAPDRGVVDADCRVHGVDNLWIAGSSVFPVAGCSNPTLTLLALAVRLADHLQVSLS